MVEAPVRATTVVVIDVLREELAERVRTHVRRRRWLSGRGVGW